MRILFAAQIDPEEAEAWLAALQEAAPGHEWRVHGPRPGRDGGSQPSPASWPAGPLDPHPSSVQADVAVVANPPAGVLAQAQGLKFIQSLWAGVDRLMADTTVPTDLPLARMVDPSMTAAMVESALWAVTALHRGFFDYATQQRRAQWLQLPQRRADDIAVLVLGLGTMGAAVGAALAARGYRVAAWRRGAAGLAPPGVTVWQGHESPQGPGPARTRPPEGAQEYLGAAQRSPEGLNGLEAAVAQADVVLNLLPLTPHTRGLIDARFLSGMKPGAALVNFGRGGHVVEADLLAALEAGTLSRAVLDVFATEPLPPEHPFWRHPRVTVLPHVAALTDLRSAAAVVADNLARLQQGRPLLHLVDRQRGY